MITVRFSTGYCIQYNDAGFSFRESSQTVIYDSPEKKRLFAIVPNDCLIEHRAPCRTYFDGTSEFKAALADARLDMRRLTRKIGKAKA